jgi:hypothetical protein
MAVLAKPLTFALEMSRGEASILEQGLALCRYPIDPDIRDLCARWRRQLAEALRAISAKPPTVPRHPRPIALELTADEAETLDMTIGMLCCTEFDREQIDVCEPPRDRMKGV